MRTTIRAFALLAAAAALLGQAHAQAQQGWGTIKGQVVWGEKDIPKMADANVDKDKPQCLAKGPIKTNDLIINPKNKGVQFVLVYLQDLKDAKNADFLPPIHESLKKFKPKVEIDQPCCTFTPRLIGLREGQTLVVKNSMEVAHNFKIDALGLNQLIPANSQIDAKGFKSGVIPSVYSCTIHTWMKGYVATFKHPYFAVTDADGKFEIKHAPAGRYRLVFWHEKAGWVIVNPKNFADRGRTITIEAGKTVTTPDVKLQLPKD